jgi:hypothetical protein
MRIIGDWIVWAVVTIWMLLPAIAILFAGGRLYYVYDHSGWAAAGLELWGITWIGGVAGGLYVLITRIVGTVFGAVLAIRRPPGLGRAER